ncbi:hypothetical protein RB195_022304 [Necator americanus]
MHVYSVLPLWDNLTMELTTMFSIILLFSLNTSAYCHESAYEKYGREINERAAREPELEKSDPQLDHVHSSNGCPHSHSHGVSHGHNYEEFAPERSENYRSSHGDNGHNHNHNGQEPKHMHSHIHSAQRSAPNPHLWTYAVGATLLISVAPCFLLYFVPIQDNSSSNKNWLKVLLAFGSGGLLGDAFLHLIPHAMPALSHSHLHSHAHEGAHSHSHGHTHIGGWVLGGIIAFLMVEKVVRIIRGENGHGHSHGPTHQKKAKDSDDEWDDSRKPTQCFEGDLKSLEKEHQPKMIKVAAYLNLVADFAHNFTDGLAIGASFVAGTTIGFVTMLTVLVHEVPHEIGDFAILVQSGYSKRKALGQSAKYNLYTATSAHPCIVIPILTRKFDPGQKY